MSEPGTDQQRAREIADGATWHRQQCLLPNFDRPCNCDHPASAGILAATIASVLTSVRAEQAATDAARIVELERFREALEAIRKVTDPTHPESALANELAHCALTGVRHAE